MTNDLVERLRALDLLVTELEGEDWFMTVNAARHEAAEQLARLHEEMIERIKVKKN